MSRFFRKKTINLKYLENKSYLSTAKKRATAKKVLPQPKKVLPQKKSPLTAEICNHFFFQKRGFISLIFIININKTKF